MVYPKTPHLSFHDKLLILRVNRISHIPPAENGARLIQEAGLQLVVFEFGEQIPVTENLGNGLATVRVSDAAFKWLPRKLRPTLFLVYSLLFLIRRLGREKPRFILTHGLHEQWLAFILNRLYHIPYACHVHEICDPQDLSPLNRILLSLERDALQNASFTVFPSRERALIYEKRYALRKKPLIAFNTPRLRPHGPISNPIQELKLPANSKTLLYIGGIGRLNALLEAVNALVFTPSNIHLLLAGWGDEHYLSLLKSRATQLGIPNRIHFLGRVKNKWDWIESADAGLCLYQGVDLRSRYNAGPSNKLFEFISAGKPVITGDAPDFKAIVEKNHLGFTANQADPHALANAMHLVFEDSAEVEKIRKNALSLHQSIYNYECQFKDSLIELKRFFPEVETIKIAS